MKEWVEMQPLMRLSINACKASDTNHEKMPMRRQKKSRKTVPGRGPSRNDTLVFICSAGS
jgi:hypothetical protein